MAGRPLHATSMEEKRCFYPQHFWQKAADSSSKTFFAHEVTLNRVCISLTLIQVEFVCLWITCFVWSLWFVNGIEAGGGVYVKRIVEMLWTERAVNPEQVTNRSCQLGDFFSWGGGGGGAERVNPRAASQPLPNLQLLLLPGFPSTGDYPGNK